MDRVNDPIKSASTPHKIPFRIKDDHNDDNKDDKKDDHDTRAPEANENDRAAAAWDAYIANLSIKYGRGINERGQIILDWAELGADTIRFGLLSPRLSALPVKDEEKSDSK